MNRLFLLAAGLGLSFSSPARTIDSLAGDCCHSRYSQNHLDAFPTAALAKEYRRLKRVRCAACDSFQSDFQKLLEVLGVRLKGATATEIKQMMGPPDAYYDGALVYYWRDTHDYLRFTFPREDRAVSSWYYALE